MKVQKQRRMTQGELERLDERVFSFICSYQLREGRAPSREEVAQSLGLSNLMAAQRAVKRLRDKQKIRFADHAKRMIEVVEFSETRLPDSLISTSGSDSWVELPFLGVVAAGQPLEALEEFEKIGVPPFLVRKNLPHFVLKVKGHSMIEAHICDGDWVIVRKQETAQNGDLVIALIDNEATLKRFEKKGERVLLHPANSEMKPILVGSHQHLRILGVYAGVIRKSLF